MNYAIKNVHDNHATPTLPPVVELMPAERQAVDRIIAERAPDASTTPTIIVVPMPMRWQMQTRIWLYWQGAKAFVVVLAFCYCYWAMTTLTAAVVNLPMTLASGAYNKATSTVSGWFGSTPPKENR